MAFEHNVVAVGASAGGVEALTRFVSGLPKDLPYAVLIVIHLPVGAPSVLAQILDRKGPLPASQAVDGEPLRTGTIRVAVPDRHLLVHDRRVVLSKGPKDSGYRPAVNTLFRSVALAFGPRAVGIVLSGVLDDGTLGSAAIRMRGGTTIAQARHDALFPTMPLNAVRAGVIEHEVPAAEMGGLLQQLAAREFDDRAMKPDARMELQNHIAMAWRFSAEFDVANSVDGALRVAMRDLQDRAKLSRRLAAHAKPGMLRDKYETVAGEAERATTALSDRLTHTHGADRDLRG